MGWLVWSSWTFANCNWALTAWLQALSICTSSRLVGASSNSTRAWAAPTWTFKERIWGRGTSAPENLGANLAATSRFVPTGPRYLAVLEMLVEVFFRLVGPAVSQLPQPMSWRALWPGIVLRVHRFSPFLSKARGPSVEDEMGFVN